MRDTRTGPPGDLQNEGAAKAFMENLMEQVRGLLEEDEPDSYETRSWPPVPTAQSGEPDRPTR